VRAAVTRRFTLPVGEGAILQAQEYLPRGPVDPTLPTVVLAHGWTLTRDAWLPVIDALLRDHPVRVIAYDQRGHGESTMGRPEQASVRLLGEDLHALIETLVPSGSVVLGGHSMGGMTIMAYAGARHPEFISRVRGVTLVGTAASVQGRTPVPLESFVMGVASRAPGIAPHFLVPTRVQGPMLFGKGADPADVRTAVAMIQRTKMPTIGKFFHAIGDHDEIESLAHFVDVPTDILVGSKDRLTPVKWARMLQESISGSTLTVLPELGHMLTYEATDDVAASLARHLT
jgi:pimeloyl-ACP methyl ester carboxylesterase